MSYRLCYVASLLLLNGLDSTALARQPASGLEEPAPARRSERKVTRRAVARSGSPARPGGRRLEPLREGPGFRVMNPAHAYGTRLTVQRLGEALARFHRRYPDAAPIVVGDLSRRGGGRMHPHASHRTGRDADIRLILNYSTRRFVDASPRTLDVEQTWFLLSALLDSGDVEYIFLNRRLQRPLYEHARSLGISPARLEVLFQFPARHKLGIIRHEPGHSGHFHVRFRRGNPPPEPTVQLPSPCSLGALAWSRTECRGPSRPL